MDRVSLALNRRGADCVKNLQCSNLFSDIVNAEQRGASGVCGQGSSDCANKLRLNLLLTKRAEKSLPRCSD
jgi:hypothetical protein